MSYGPGRAEKFRGFNISTPKLVKFGGDTAPQAPHEPHIIYSYSYQQNVSNVHEQVLVAEDVMIEIFDAENICRYTSHAVQSASRHFAGTSNRDRRYGRLRGLVGRSHSTGTTVLYNCNWCTYSSTARVVLVLRARAAYWPRALCVRSSDEDHKRLEIRLLNMQLYADAEAEAAARETKAARVTDEFKSGDVRRAMLSPFGLDRRKGLSSKEFHEVYDGTWPVFLADCARDWPAISRWRRDRLLERLSDREWLAVESLVEGEYSIIETEHMSVSELARRAREANSSSYLLASDPSYFAERSLQTEGFELSSCAPLRQNLLRL